MVSPLCNYVIKKSHGGNKMKLNKVLMALMAVFALSLVSFGVMAYRGEPSVEGPNYDADVHEQLEAALEARDYELWLSIREENNLPTRGKIFSVIDSTNFDKYVNLHEANMAGDVDSANIIRAELGLGQGMMRRGNGMRSQGSQFKGSNSNFVDTDNDGNCDNLGMNLGRGKR